MKINTNHNKAKIEKYAKLLKNRGEKMINSEGSTVTCVKREGHLSWILKGKWSAVAWEMKTSFLKRERTGEPMRFENASYKTRLIK